MEEVFSTCHLRVDAVPLLEAARLGRIKLVRILVEGGANINATNPIGQGALTVAVVSDDVIDADVRLQMVRYLLRHGADVDGTDGRGRTALTHSCLRGVGQEIVRLLINSGADVLHRDKYDKNSLEYARQRGDHAVTSLLADQFRETLRRPVAPPVRRPNFGTGEEGSGEIDSDPHNSCDAQLRRQLFRKKSISLQESVAKNEAPLSDEPVQRRDRKLRRRHTTNMSDKCRELFDKLERTKDHSEQAEVLGDVLSTLITTERNLWSGDPEQQVEARSRPSRPSSVQSAGSEDGQQRRTGDPEAAPDEDVDSPSGVSGLADTTERSGPVSNRLLDHLSVTRPGQLPALNVNLAKPIPGIVKLDTPTDIENDRPR